MAAGRNRVLFSDWVGYAAVRVRALFRRAMSPGPERAERFAPQPRPTGLRARYRQWRRTRPFWGGLLLILSGGVLVLIPLSGILLHGAIKLVIYIGIGGVFGVLIGILLITCGLLLWFTPAHRTFYAVAGVVLAMLSFITSNLGGFFLGMLLGITGGSLAFGWTPREYPPEGYAAEDGDSLDDAGTAILPIADEDPGGQRGPGTGTGTGAGRLMASAAMPAVLLGSLLTGFAGHSGQADQPGDCILGIICLPSSPAPSPAPATSVDPSPSSSSPATSTAPGPSPSATSSPGTPTLTAPSSGFAASVATSVITAGSATLNGLAYQGAAKVPVAGGTQTMMKFTLNSMTLSGNVTATVTENGQTTVTQSSSLVFGGGVTLYATKLSGSLLGIPLTLTPQSVVSLLLHVLNTVTPAVPVTMTNVTTDQPFVLSGSLQATNLVITS